MSDPVISLTNVGKMYKLYPNRTTHLLAAVGIDRLRPRHRTQAREFWAVRGVNLELSRGQRVGIIGRNGAGKSTLLKLITGNLAPSEGQVAVNGEVRALIDAGGGFHPEFTGYENIRSALIYQGLQPEEIRAAEDEIADFTELGDFLNQPFKTYSLGMQTRLTFATATAIKPDILIVDEILGAGDAYFLSKSTERMRALVGGGATVLLVSHSLDQIMMFCDEAVWVDRGRIVDRGSSLDVCKAYEKHVKVLEDRRLRAKNLKVTSSQYHSLQFDQYGDHLVIRFEADGERGDAFDVTAVELLSDNRVEERLLVGEAQDVEPSQPAFVVLDACEWSAPMAADNRRLRRLAPNGVTAVGQVLVYLWAFFPDSVYSLDVTYRTVGRPTVRVSILRSGELIHSSVLPESADWETRRIDFGLASSATTGTEASPSDEERPRDDAPAQVSSDQVDADDQHPEAAAADVSADANPAIPDAPSRHASRWPGEGSVLIDRVRLLDSDGLERAVFRVGEEMVVDMESTVRRPGALPIIPVAVLFRRDGVLISRFIGEEVAIVAKAGDRIAARLPLGPLNLGNAHYVFSVALYRKLDVQNIEPVVIYDLIDRSYEFEVYGTPPLVTGVFRHPGCWEVVPDGAGAGHV